jgi:hypothetical protein
MARTLIDGLDQILAGSVGRASMNTATTGQALITKVIAGTGVSLSSTGVDAGTGDVTVNISLASPPAIGGTTPNAGTFNPLTATGQFTCTYNAGPLAYPTAANGGAMMWNYISGAAGEVDFWNLDTAATTAFSFLQLTGPASFTAVATILPNGTFSSPIAIFNTLYSTGVSFTGGTINNVPVGNTTPSSGAFTTLSASSGLNGTAVGNTTASTGAFTSLSATGLITFTAGTIDGVTIGGTTPSSAAFSSLTVASSPVVQVWIMGPAASPRSITFLTSPSFARWDIGADTASETGSSAGSNFEIISYSDLGAGTVPFTINRATGLTGLTSLSVSGVTTITAGAASVLNVSDSAYGSTNQITLTGTGINGANIKLIGDGATTPNKSIRAKGGSFQVLNSAYSAAILSITDGGTLTTTNVTAGGAVSAGTNTVLGNLIVNGPVANNRVLRFQTAGLGRWSLFADGTAESGSNAGSNLVLYNYDDSGTVIGTAFSMTRATGNALFSYNLSVSGNFTASSTVSGTGFSTYLASPPAIGGTTPAAGKFTTLSASSGNVLNDCGRNRVDNGNMEVAQRALPVTITGNYVLDRWRCGWSAGTASATQTTFGGYTSRKQLALTVTGLTAGNVAFFIHRIEAARCADLAGQTVTVSFNFAYTISAGTTAFACILAYPTIVDAFGTVTTIATVAFTPTSGTAGTYSATFAVPSAATTGLQITVQATQASATGTLFAVLTSVQLEAGASATQFERLDPAENLQRCQWFCQYHLAVMAVGYNAATGQVVSEFSYPVTMRAIPVLTIDSPAYGNASAFAQNAIYASHVRVQAIITTTGLGWGVGNLLLSADL